MKDDKNKRKVEEKKESTKENIEELERKSIYEKKQKRIKQTSERERDVVIAAIKRSIKERQEKTKQAQNRQLEEENKGGKEKDDKDTTTQSDTGESSIVNRDEGKDNEKSEDKKDTGKSEEKKDTEESGTGLDVERDEHTFVTLEDKERESCESPDVGREQSVSSNKFTVHYNTFSTCNLPIPSGCDLSDGIFKPKDPDDPKSKMPVVEVTRKDEFIQSINLKDVNACEDPIRHMCGGLEEDTSKAHVGFKTIIKEFKNNVELIDDMEEISEYVEDNTSGSSLQKEWELLTRYLLDLCEWDTKSVYMHDSNLFLDMRSMFIFVDNRDSVTKSNTSSTAVILGAAFASGVNVFMSVRYVPRLSYNKNGENLVLRLEGAPHDLPPALLNLRTYSEEEKHSWREQHVTLIAKLLMDVNLSYDGNAGVHYAGVPAESWKKKKEEFKRRADSLLKFICSMIEHTRVNNHTPPRDYHPPLLTNVIELDKPCKTLFWSDFFKGVVSVFTDFKMTSETDFEVAGVDTLGVCTLVRHVDETTILDFLRLNTFKALAPFSP
eukprot:GHVR01123294.1.p1 GENE.GHVR01123294.1~~GHVR01123294.1.p1  ORF type:complete len:551 (+),score=106.72 GHVR01123294.1:130-1782(+)